MPAKRDTPLVSVIVPVRDDEAGLSVCLEHLEGQDYPPRRYEIIVVDNGSASPLDALVARHPHARLVLEPQPGSYAARNAGIAVAGGDILAFTDADCCPRPAWISEGVKALQTHPRAGLVAGRIEVVPSDPARPTWSETYQLHKAFRQDRYVELSSFGATANVFTRRSVVAAAGPFDGRLRSSGDLEWGKRVARAGFEILYAHAAIVDHPARQTLRELVAKTRRVATGHATLAMSSAGRRQRSDGTGGAVAAGRTKRGWRRAARLLTPPVRRYREGARDVAAMRPGTHVRLFLIEYVLNVAEVTALARFRLQRGRSPR